MHWTSELRYRGDVLLAIERFHADPCHCVDQIVVIPLELGLDYKADVYMMPPGTGCTYASYLPGTGIRRTEYKYEVVVYERWVKP